MFTANKPFGSKFLSFFLSLLLGGSCLSAQCPALAADTNDLNFKVYNPDSASPSNSTTNPGSSDQGLSGDMATAALKTSIPNQSNPGSATSNQPGSANPGLSAETPHTDSSIAPADNQTSSTSTTTVSTTSSTPDSTNENKSGTNSEVSSNQPGGKSSAAKDTDASDSTIAGDSASPQGNNKVLQGYVRIVPSGTKIPIVMDTAVDSDTSQEGDEFSARTVEDLTIDGTTVIPAGSIIRGRIATLAAPKHLNRSGSVALKFDTVTTPDNRQIPLVANLVARGGVVHARRGIKDISIDTATFALPTAIALGIGAVAGHSSSSVGMGGGALIGAGVGAAVGLAILLAKKGKKVDVRPGDELKIELAEDLHMPTM